MALLDTPSLLEGAFLLPAHKTLLLSDTCIMVRLARRQLSFRPAVVDCCAIVSSDAWHQHAPQPWTAHPCMIASTGVWRQHPPPVCWHAAV